MSQSNAQGSTLMATQAAAARIQRATAKSNGGQVGKGSFAARTQSAAEAARHSGGKK